jgi:hypothetical protein
MEFWPYNQGFVLWRIFATWRQKKRGGAGEFNKGDFEKKNFKNSPYFEGKKKKKS